MGHKTCETLTLWVGLLWIGAMFGSWFSDSQIENILNNQTIDEIISDHVRCVKDHKACVGTVVFQPSDTK